MPRGAQLLLGIALLAGAGVVDRASSHGEAPRGETTSLTLTPLGPVKAIISSALWVLLVDSQLEGDERRVATIARALLEVHPGLSVVREYLANQLIVTEAPQAQSAERHDALIMLGLSLLEDGLVLCDDPRLHSALGRTLAIQRFVDKHFTPAAERFLGSSLEDVAIDELALSEASIDKWLRADLLVERGLDSMQRFGDRWPATRDLEEAAATLARLEPLNEQDAEAARSRLQPLRDALAVGGARRGHGTGRDAEHDAGDRDEK